MVNTSDFTDENGLEIKESEFMENPNESNWFDADEQPDNYKDIIDDNDDVDCETIQKIKVSSEAFKSIENVKKEVLPDTFQQQVSKPKINDFVIIYKNMDVFVGNNKKEVKRVCEKIIIENEDIVDDDLMIFFRVPLNEIFK